MSSLLGGVPCLVCWGGRSHAQSAGGGGPMSSLSHVHEQEVPPALTSCLNRKYLRSDILSEQEVPPALTSCLNGKYVRYQK